MEHTYMTVEEMSPTEFQEYILQILRDAERPLATHEITVQVLHKILGLPPTFNQTHGTKMRVIEALIELQRMRRINGKSNGKTTIIYKPVHRTAEIENQVEAITICMGGRRPLEIGDGHDPFITVEAPLSTFIGCIFPNANKND